MYCRGCGYNLAGLEESRCPECGRGFDRAVPNSYLLKPRVRTWRSYLYMAIALLVVLSGAAVGGVGWLYKGYMREEAAVAMLGPTFRTVREPIGPKWIEKGMPAKFKPYLLRVTSVNRQCRGLNDDDARAIAQFHYLQSLRLWYMHVTDAQCDAMKDLDRLQSLQVYGYEEFSDAGAAHLLKSNHLRTVNFADVKITDATVPRLVQLPELETLKLDGTMITDAGLEQLVGAPKLRELSLRRMAGVSNEAIERFKSRRSDVKVIVK